MGQYPERDTSRGPQGRVEARAAASGAAQVAPPPAPLLQAAGAEAQPTKPTQVRRQRGPPKEAFGAGQAAGASFALRLAERLFVRQNAGK